MRIRVHISAVVALATGIVALAMPAVDAAPPAPLAVGAERAMSWARPGIAQTGAAAAFTNGLFFVVWQESEAGRGDAIYGARVTPDGTVLDRAGLLLSTLPRDQFTSNVRPRVAGGGGKFLVVWQIDKQDDYSDLGAAMVTTGGAVQKRWGLSFVDNGQFSPDVAWNGRLFLATWQDEPDPGDEDIYGARVTVGGLTLDGCSSDSCPNGDDPGITIAIGPGNQLAPVVAGSTDMWVVAWTDTNDPNRTIVRDSAVAVAGLSLDEAGFDITQGPGAQTTPALASNGPTTLFAWTNTTASRASDIHAATMKPGGEANYQPTPVPAGGVTVSAARGNQSDPAVARRSGHFVVAWTDERSGNADIVASRVGVAGAVLDPNGVIVAGGPRQQQAPALASSGPRVLVAYEREAPAAPSNGVSRVVFRMVS